MNVINKILIIFLFVVLVGFEQNKATDIITNATKVSLSVIQNGISTIVKPQATTPILSGVTSVTTIKPTTKSSTIKPLSNATVASGQSYNINLSSSNVLSLDATL